MYLDREVAMVPNISADILNPSRILIVSLNYSPEEVGIGPYSAGMAEYLASSGVHVDVIAAQPYYPAWKPTPGYGLRRYRRSSENGVSVTRCPLYVPKVPGGAKRVLHHLSFALAIILPLFRMLISGKRPDLVAVVAPSMMAAPVARMFARLTGARLWLHIQDFEVGAAFATGLISSRSLVGRMANIYQNIAYRGFDLYSSISPQMCAKLAQFGIPAHKVFEFRNWAETDAMRPMASSDSPYRRHLGITTPHVALYSGIISRKQGIEIVIDAANALLHRKDITFVICGDGPNKKTLIERAAGLSNIKFIDLQPRTELGNLLGLATIHLLPQIAGAADLVLPSKLTNMLASGKPIVATAVAGTGLANEVDGCGVVVQPGDTGGLAAAIAKLIDHSEDYAAYARRCEERAQETWAKRSILRRLCERLDSEFRVLRKARSRPESQPEVQTKFADSPDAQLASD